MSGERGFQFGDETGPAIAERRQLDRLVASYQHLEIVLESVDLDRDPAVGDAVIHAVLSIERAYHLTARQSHSPRPVE